MARFEHTRFELTRFEHPRFEYPLNLRMLAASALLVWVASFTHEFSHHLVGAMVCGDVGRMSLNRFVLADPCAGPWPIATAAGPALSYLMMWLGAWLAWRGRRPLPGFLLVVAYIPFLRLLTALAGGGDEGLLLRQWSPAHARWLAPLLVLSMVLPPLATCYRALCNLRRKAVFAAAFLLPLLPVLPVPAVDGHFLDGWLSGEVGMPHAFGIPDAVWLVHGAMLVLCALFAVRPLLQAGKLGRPSSR
jgi:hypothetical protein